MNLANWQRRLGKEFFFPAAVPLALIAAWMAWLLWHRRWPRVLAAPVLALVHAVACRSVLKIGGYFK